MLIIPAVLVCSSLTIMLSTHVIGYIIQNIHGLPLMLWDMLMERGEGRGVGGGVEAHEHIHTYTHTHTIH